MSIKPPVLAQDCSRFPPVALEHISTDDPRRSAKIRALAIRVGDPMPGIRALRQVACVAVIVFVVVGVGTPARADTIVMTFSVCIDGRDLLLIQGSTVQWQVMDYIPPGVPTADCPANPTTISTTLNGQKVVDKFQWFPIFEYPASAGSLSSVLDGLKPSLPSSDMQVTARVVQARGSEGIQQLPTSANGYTLILNFDDEEALGEGLYTIEVTIITP